MDDSTDSFDGSPYRSAYDHATDVDDDRDWEDDPAPLDRRPGNGSSSVPNEFNDQMAFKPNDGRSLTRTTFPIPSNVTGEAKQRWERLRSLNDGVGHPDRSQHNEWADRKRWIDIVASTLSLPDWLTERTHTVAQRMAFQPYAGAGIPIEGVILALVTMLHDRHVDVDSVDEWLLNRDEMNELLEGLGLSTSDLWTAIKLLKEHCYLFNDDKEPGESIMATGTSSHNPRQDESEQTESDSVSDDEDSEEPAVDWTRLQQSE